MSDIQARAARETCPRCGTQVTPAVLSCPSCGGLVHAAELKTLAANAEAASAAGDVAAALTSWREALGLLPPGTRQHETVSQRISELSARVEAQPSAAPASDGRSSRRAATTAGLGAGALLLWKFKAVFVLVATKGKLLLLGLTKGSTLLSMLLSFGVYWTAWGWTFALGVVLSIYVHEMGHVAMLRRYGIKASAPMFIPGLGALVRMQQYPHDPREDARVGLAGPMWGLGATLFAYAVGIATGWQSCFAIAKVGAWINLFNLIPVWQLDGSRGFSSLVRPHRWIATGAIALAWFLTGESMLLLLLIAAVFRAFGAKLPARPDPSILVQYAGLVLALAWLCTIPVST